ncbi:SHOCT domain-containing protein [Pseudonocardia xishanensis]
MADGLVVTSARVMAFGAAQLQAGKVALEIVADQIARVDLQKRFSGRNCLIVGTRDGAEINFGDLPAPDAPMVLAHVQRLAAFGLSPEVGRAVSARADTAGREDSAWRQVRAVGGRISEKTWGAIRDRAMPGEVAWFAVGGESGGGALAAFGDRCLIVKVRAMTSMMAGSLGGGRITTFPYGEITGIEYNAGMLNGVLEILTPSYQGSGNKDYWRGSLKPTNSNSNNPWTLSNTLPMSKPLYQQALPMLNEMRGRIAEVKRPTVVMNAQQATVPVGGGLADEIGKLAALRVQGLLTDDEFEAAKRAAIARVAP